MFLTLGYLYHTIYMRFACNSKPYVRVHHIKKKQASDLVAMLISTVGNTTRSEIQMRFLRISECISKKI